MESIKQHFVPQFYLRNFGQKIFCLDKTNEQNFQASPRTIAFGSNFYGPTINGSNPLESRFSELEGEFSSSINEFIEKGSVSNISTESFRRLCGFIALQYLRTLEVRKQFEGVGNDLLRSLLKLDFPQWSNQTIDGISVSDSLNLLTHLKILGKYTSFANVVVHMKFVTLKNKTNIPFWTSDNPIAIDNKIEQSFYSGNGIVTEGIELHIPITSKLSILVCDPITFETKPALINIKTEKDINRENWLQIFSSTRFLFSDTNSFHKSKEMLDENPDLKNPDRKRSETKIIKGKDMPKEKLRVWATHEILSFINGQIEKTLQISTQNKSESSNYNANSKYIHTGFFKINSKFNLD